MRLRNPFTLVLRQRCSFGSVTVKPGYRGSALSVFCILFLTFFLMPGGAGAEEVRAAVASNFLVPLRAVVKSFEKDTRHQVRIISGSTGKLYAQIKQGAPFDVFLAADRERPVLLVKEGLATPDSRFVYAVGRLALWSPDASRIVDNAAKILNDQNFRHLAIANPKTAPYGRAAREVLMALDAWEKVRPQLVQGENISQTFQFVVSRNAELGFVALSQVRTGKFKGQGGMWEVPENFHSSLVQEAVLLRRGEKNLAAVALMEYLGSGKIQELIKSFGYGLER